MILSVWHYIAYALCWCAIKKLHTYSGGLCTSSSLDVNRRAVQCTSPVFVVWQCKLMSGWGLRKCRSAPPYGYGPCSSARTLRWRSDLVTDDFHNSLSSASYCLMGNWPVLGLPKVRVLSDVSAHWVTSLSDLTFAEPARGAKVRSKYLLKPKIEVISLRKSLTCKSMF